MQAHFTNRQNVDLTPLPKRRWYSKRQYEYNAHPILPMTYVDTSSVQWRPDKHYQTDMGSVPAVVQVVPGFRKDDWLCSFLCHDSSYNHGGLWRKGPTDDEWTFFSMTRKQADRMLYRMCRAEGAPRLVARLIYRGVRLGRFVGVRYNQRG